MHNSINRARHSWLDQEPRNKNKQKQQPMFVFSFYFWIPVFTGMTVLGVLLPQYARATEEIKAVTFSPDLSSQTTLTLNSEASKLLGNSWSAVSADDTVFLGADAGGGGVVAWNLASGGTKTWFPYGATFRGGVALTHCWRNSRQEIATVPVAGNAHVLRFDLNGKQLSPGFFVQSTSVGTSRDLSLQRVICGDVNGDSIDEIFIGRRLNNDLTIFITNATDGKLLKSFQITDWGPYDFHLGRIDLGGDGIDEILVGAGGMMEPEVRIYRNDGTLINRFAVFPTGFVGGVFVHGADYDDDKKEELTVGAGPGGGHVRILDGFGVEKMTSKLFPLGEDFRSGIIPLVLNAKPVGDAHARPRIGVADLRPLQLVALSSSLPTTNIANPKSILIDIAAQRLSVLSFGYESAKFPISTGTWNYPTPLGKHAIANKIKRAYSRRYGLFMPWWMAIVPSGQYGIHELPEWPNGAKEGEGHLGERRSHGCIRLGVGPAKAVYDWAGVGVPVTVK